jgi:glycosyltransferase involved in cell wall biosynthesis
MVELLGNLDRDGSRSAYRTHELMHFPALGDEWGLVTDEALHSGMSVIVSRAAQSAEELVQHRVSGWSYDVSDENALGQCLSEYVALSIPERIAMRRAARASVCDRTPAVAAQELLKVITSVNRRR